MDEQQFCLKWNNHQGNLITVFHELLSNESLVDVTLACEGYSIKAHKVILSACSPFFEELFKNNPCKHPIVIMKDMKYTDLKTIIQYMYNGEVNVSQDRLSALLKTAESLQVKGLAEVSSDSQSMNGEHSRTTQSIENQSHNEIQTVPAVSKVRHNKRGHSPLINEQNNQTSNSRKCLSSPDIEEIPAKQSRDVHLSSKPSSDKDGVYNVTSHSYQESLKYSNDQGNPLREKNQGDESVAYELGGAQNNTFADISNGDNHPSADTHDFNCLPEQNSKDSYSVNSDDDDVKPSSPTVLPIPIESEVTCRIKSSPSYDNYSGYDAEDSQQMFNESTFDSPAVSLMELSNDNIMVDDVGSAGPSSLAAELGAMGSNTGRPLSSGDLESNMFTGFLCPKCNRTFMSRKGMMNHYRHKHEGKHFSNKCHLCDQCFMWSSQLSKHLDDHHKLPKEFQCGLCDKYFHYENCAFTHHKSAHNGMDYQIIRDASYRKSRGQS